MKLFPGHIAAGLFAAGLWLTPIAQAEEPMVVESTSFTANRWTRGLHLLAGMGVNAAYFNSDIIKRQAGVGLSVQTSVGYYLFENYAFEINTDVMFNKTEGLLVWDTQGTAGMRARLPSYLGPRHSSPYARFLVGKGPSVLIYKGSRPTVLKESGKRSQVEGDIYGLSYGFFQNAREGQTWYLEITGAAHIYQQIEGIAEEKGVPRVVSSVPLEGAKGMTSLSLTFGVVIF